MAATASSGVLLSVLIFVALLVGPKNVLNALFNVSPYHLPAHMSFRDVSNAILTGHLVSYIPNSGCKWEEVHARSGIYIPQWANG